MNHISLSPSQRQWSRSKFNLTQLSPTGRARPAKIPLQDDLVGGVDETQTVSELEARTGDRLPGRLQGLEEGCYYEGLKLSLG